MRKKMTKYLKKWRSLERMEANQKPFRYKIKRIRHIRLFIFCFFNIIMEQN